MRKTYIRTAEAENCWYLDVAYGDLAFDMLVDTGASPSVIDHKAFLSFGENRPVLKPCSKELFGANGSKLDVYGEIELEVSVEGETVLIDAVVADLGKLKGIIGMQFLMKYRICFDICHGLLSSPEFEFALHKKDGAEYEASERLAQVSRDIAPVDPVKFSQVSASIFEGPEENVVALVDMNVDDDVCGLVPPNKEVGGVGISALKSPDVDRNPCDCEFCINVVTHDVTQAQDLKQADDSGSDSQVAENGRAHCSVTSSFVDASEGGVLASSNMELGEENGDSLDDEDGDWVSKMSGGELAKCHSEHMGEVEAGDGVASCLNIVLSSGEESGVSEPVSSASCQKVAAGPWRAKRVKKPPDKANFDHFLEPGDEDDPDLPVDGASHPCHQEVDPWPD